MKMIYKDPIATLLREGVIKKCQTDYRTIDNLLKRAQMDLVTAIRNTSEDEECSYTYAYNSMLRSGLALMNLEGYRPNIRDKHLTIVRFVSSIFGEEYANVINNYDFMRRKRNSLIYEPDIPCSKKEAEDAIKTAQEFVEIISKHIRSKYPQKEFDL
jgi:uncharacterized protein (UPF0332 family)